MDSPETQKSKYLESAVFFLLIKKFSYYKFCHTVNNSLLAEVNLDFFFSGLDHVLNSAQCIVLKVYMTKVVYLKQLTQIGLFLEVLIQV